MFFSNRDTPVGLKKKNSDITSLCYFRQLFCLKNLTDQSWNCAMPSDATFEDCLLFSGLLFFSFYFFGTFVHGHSSDSSQHCSLRPSGWSDANKKEHDLNREKLCCLALCKRGKISQLRMNIIQPHIAMFKVTTDLYFIINWNRSLNQIH